MFKNFFQEPGKVIPVVMMIGLCVLITICMAITLQKPAPSWKRSELLLASIAAEERIRDLYRVAVERCKTSSCVEVPAYVEFVEHLKKEEIVFARATPMK